MTHTVPIPASGLKVGHSILNEGIVRKVRRSAKGNRLYVTVFGARGAVDLRPIRLTDTVTVIKGRS